MTLDGLISTLWQEQHGKLTSLGFGHNWKGTEIQFSTSEQVLGIFKDLQQVELLMATVLVTVQTGLPIKQ